MAGGDRLCLRLPTLVCHIIDEDSPLEHWAESSGILLDADSEVVVVVSCCFSNYSALSMPYRALGAVLMLSGQSVYKYASSLRNTSPASLDDTCPHDGRYST